MSEHILQIKDLSVGYGESKVLQGLNLALEKGAVTAIIGPNACGKSTLLRAMTRLLVPQTGQVLLEGVPIHTMAPRQLARRIGLLPQTPIAPEGISVLDLVSRGRHPHQGLFGRWRAEDDAAVAKALELTGTSHLAERMVGDLSGGQRQRVWIAMALTQQTDILLLDEPTTYLDINHQIEVLDLLAELNRSRGTTIVMVLHELNLAARYADLLVAMRDGDIHAAGSAQDILTEVMLSQVFGLTATVIPDPVSSNPMMIPRGRFAGRGKGNESARRTCLISSG